MMGVLGNAFKASLLDNPARPSAGQSPSPWGEDRDVPRGALRLQHLAGTRRLGSAFWVGEGAEDAEDSSSRTFSQGL